MSVRIRHLVSFGLVAAGLSLVGGVSAAQAQDHSSQCVAIGYELGDRSDAAQDELDKLNDIPANQISDEDQAEIDDLQELLDNLATISASMSVLYDEEDTPPDQDELETVHGADINDLLNAAQECIDNA